MKKRLQNCGKRWQQVMENMASRNNEAGARGLERERWEGMETQASRA